MYIEREETFFSDFGEFLDVIVAWSLALPTILGFFIITSPAWVLFLPYYFFYLKPYRRKKEK